MWQSQSQSLYLDGIDRKHGIEDVGSLVFVEVVEEDVPGDGLRQGGHGLVVLWHHFLDVGRGVLLGDGLSGDGTAPAHCLLND